MLDEIIRFQSYLLAKQLVLVLFCYRPVFREVFESFYYACMETAFCCLVCSPEPPLPPCSPASLCATMNIASRHIIICLTYFACKVLQAGKDATRRSVSHEFLPPVPLSLTKQWLPNNATHTRWVKALRYRQSSQSILANLCLL